MYNEFYFVFCSEARRKQVLINFEKCFCHNVYLQFIHRPRLVLFIRIFIELRNEVCFCDIKHFNAQTNACFCMYNILTLYFLPCIYSTYYFRLNEFRIFAKQLLIGLYYQMKYIEK